MEANICPTCGCSLVRLGINQDEAASRSYENKEYRFCCEGCAKLFIKDPKTYVDRIEDVIVCPTCLAEKPISLAVSQNYNGEDIYFCGCSHCMGEFKNNPEFYIERLSGKIGHQGVFGDACCTIN